MHARGQERPVRPGIIAVTDRLALGLQGRAKGDVVIELDRRPEIGRVAVVRV